MRHSRGPLWFAIPAFFVSLFAAPNSGEKALAANTSATGSGSLSVVGKDGTLKGTCPLKHTEVRGKISGFIARVNVTQAFENSAAQTIEAIYTFPLPQDAAVDDMTIQVGDRTIRSSIKRREEARAIYEKAKTTGHTAALLDQERPNIFTQAVANILPGEQVKVTISYVETLQYQDGTYEFVFPMVVGPRYIPGDATGKESGGGAHDRDQVPDRSRITPPVAPKGTRAGHDISIELAIDAGVPIQELGSKSHRIDIERTSANGATIRLQNQSEIPNRDFILSYDVAGGQIEDALLTQSSSPRSKLGPGGYFTFILQPPARVPESDITPKELVFVLDTSGSMDGFPLDKAKELIVRALDELYPGDTFNLITFAGDTQILFPEPVYPTAENIRLAKKFLAGHSGGGGTEMMKAIRAALDPSDKQDHVRIVCFASDGYVGNDMEIIGEVQKHPNARVFAFGIGTAVNRFLLEGMAKAGRGNVEFVTLAEKADSAAHRLYEQLRSPLLTDISIDWEALPVKDVYPQRLPDLFSGKPLVLTGRYTAVASGKIRVRGKRAGEEFTREIPVSFRENGNQHDVLPSFWARRRIDDLMSQDWSGAQAGQMKPGLQNEIMQLGLDYRLMTQFTSFVAVEERVVTKDGVRQRLEVPVEMPDGVSYEGVFGDRDKLASAAPMGLLSFSTVNVATGRAARMGGGFGGRGYQARKMAPLPPPPALATGTPVSGGESAASAFDDKKPTGDRAVLESKLHPALLKVFDCWKRSRNDCASAKVGKIEIQIWTSKPSAALLDQLQALGFEAAKGNSTGKLVGRLAVDKLPEIARISEIRFISLIRA